MSSNLVNVNRPILGKLVTSAFCRSMINIKFVSMTLTVFMIDETKAVNN